MYTLKVLFDFTALPASRIRTPTRQWKRQVVSQTKGDPQGVLRFGEISVQPGSKRHLDKLNLEVMQRTGHSMKLTPGICRAFRDADEGPMNVFNFTAEMESHAMLFS